MSDALLSSPPTASPRPLATARALTLAFVVGLAVLQAVPVASWVRPFAPLFDKLGLGQRWNLFTSSGQFAYQLQIEGLRVDQSARLLYRASELDLLGLAPRLTYRRLRGIYDPRSKLVARAQYEPLAHWLGELVLAEHPEFVGVRVSVRRLRLAAPGRRAEVASVEHTSETYRPGTP